jgi:hypothetical protein
MVTHFLLVFFFKYIHSTLILYFLITTRIVLVVNELNSVAFLVVAFVYCMSVFIIVYMCMCMFQMILDVRELKLNLSFGLNTTLN